MDQVWIKSGLSPKTRDFAVKVDILTNISYFSMKHHVLVGEMMYLKVRYSEVQSEVQSGTLQREIEEMIY